jgi:hypothetical protein
LLSVLCYADIWIGPLSSIDLLSPTAYLFLWLVFGCRIVLLVVFKEGKKNKKKGDAMTWNSEKQD